MKHRQLHMVFLALIILIGVGLRVVALDKNPAGFFCDEAAIGYNAYSILTTGKDEYGIPFPAFFRSFGEYKSPLAIYTAIPFIQLFGLTEWTIRFQSVLFGIVTLVMVYVISKKLFTKNVALLSILIAATMPWMIHYNRTGFEMNSYLALFTTTVYLLLKATNNKRFLIPAAIVATLSLYTYYSAKLIVPLFVIGFFLIYGKKFISYKKELTLSSIFFLLLSIPFLISFLNGEGTARFQEVSVFTAKLSPGDTLLRMFNNYFLQLSPTFFLKGEPTFITRHFTGGLTPLLLVTIPFLYLGIGYIFKHGKQAHGKLLLLWLLLYPLSAAVVAEGPFTGRTFVGAPLFAILIALGITTTVRFLKPHGSHLLASTAIGILLFLNVITFTQFYFQKYPLYSADFWGWQHGPKEIIAYFEREKNSYDEFYLSGEFNAPYIFIKFYAPQGCTTCLVGAPHETYSPTKKQLFAISPTYIAAHPEITFATKKLVRYPNGSPAFLIGEVKRIN